MYDILLGFRPPPPVSGEILLIETDEIVEPGDVFSVLMALSEMGALDLLIEVPVLGTDSGGMESGADFVYRINDEFNLLGSNIRNLFEAIRMGLVSPADSPAYVESLVELAERGRERLNSALIRQNEAGSQRAAQAAAVFDRVTVAVDLREQPLGDVPWYSQPSFDEDRILRRIAPKADGAEHIAYRALKRRWKESLVELTDAGPVLINRFERQEETAENRFPLDRNGKLLLEKPSARQNFRSLSLELIREYETADRAMARLLKEAEALGIYAETLPEQIPLILFDYADVLKEELLKNPGEEMYAAWKSARLEYIASLDDFLYGPAEMIMVNGYEELIAGELHEEEGVARLQGLRDELIRAFVSMREKHLQLVELHSVLARELASSFCIMGPTGPVTESSALLANALLNGNCITPGQSLHIVFWSVAVSLAVLACIHSLAPLAILLAGIAAGIICITAFGTSFVISAYWIHPLIPMAGCLAGTLVLAVSRFCIGYGRVLRFKLAYGPSVNRDMLKQLLKTGRPFLAETVCTGTVIIAVKNHTLLSGTDTEKPIDAAKISREFVGAVSRIGKQAGAQLLGFESDTALVCFGSPLEQAGRNQAGLHSQPPVIKAVQLAADMMHDPFFAGCSFGIESGECAFFWSEETGYTANGQAATRARIFASLAKRLQVRGIIGESVREAASLDARKLSAFSGENMYELPV